MLASDGYGARPVMDVVYHAFEGRFCDSPRAIYSALAERPDFGRHLWLADPRHLADFPAGIETAPWGSAAGIDALESADLLVANSHTDLVWRKKPGATYLQTWHGTPFKRIHHDVLWAPEGRLERLSKDVDQWDLLVSPSRVSTRWLRQAFRFDGEVLETGYPRNDVLSGPERDAVRARVRHDLGIADGVTAVLYAPTWRDDVVFSGDGGAIDLQFDADAFVERLGDDHCLLLRLHYMLTGRLAPVRHAAVKDVSWHSEVSELYLAADVLVTDYSSVMFDWAVTGKPIVYYAYDLEDFERRVRGFYFDLRPEAPGPMLQTSAEVLDALEDLPGVVDAYAERYRAFRARYCHLEDGHATDRVVERTLARAQATAGQGA